ncbi:hypothetical protein SAMN05428962_0435 [Paenibacillus sp. BC26]|nr:hypothetical protein SAMN05428962_0435 [Paenibacillus sp. BC26]
MFGSMIAVSRPQPIHTERKQEDIPGSLRMPNLANCGRTKHRLQTSIRSAPLGRIHKKNPARAATTTLMPNRYQLPFDNHFV